MDELKACPCCGGQPDFQHFNIAPNVQGRIVCSCGLELRQGKNDTEDDMRIIWNTRSDYAVQAESERKAEQAIAATLETPISADLRTALDFMRIWITDDAHLGESAISYEFEKAEGLRKLDAIESAIADTLGRGTCEWPTDVEGQRIQIADTIHMLRTEYDGDHEWEDVVIELVYVEYGGDKWVVRGARGEAWACECTVTGHDDELYDNSGDWSNLPTPCDRPEPDGWYKCPNPSCGCVVGYSLLADDSWTIYMDDYQIPFNHCPQCGKAVAE